MMPLLLAGPCAPSGRRRYRLLPILLSAQRGEFESYAASWPGANDHIVKPFSYPQLRARLEALLCRRVAGRTRSGPTSRSVRRASASPGGTAASAISSS